MDTQTTLRGASLAICPADCDMQLCHSHTSPGLAEYDTDQRLEVKADSRLACVI